MQGKYVSICALLLCCPLAATAADDYYLTLFSAETVPFRSVHTHTFLTVHRISGADGSIEEHHISWVPANLKPRSLTLLPEAGTNLGVAETFKFCRAHSMRVSVWGPYQIKPELFELMKEQSARLESGKIKYKPTDNLYPACIAANCYHAIWQPVAPCRKYSGPFNCGDASGSSTLRLFQKWLIAPCQSHDAVLELIVPQGEQVVRRSFEDRPVRVDAIRSALSR